MLLNIYSGNLSGMYDLLSLIGLSSWSVIVLPTSAFMHYILHLVHRTCHITLKITLNTRANANDQTLVPFGTRA